MVVWYTRLEWLWIVLKGSLSMTNMLAERRKFQEWQTTYDSKAPKVGDLALDFELCDVHGKNPVRLSGFRNQKPVALIFGSFT